MKILCRIGIHRWVEAFSARSNHEVIERRCKKCGKKENYLGGMGGQEIGCWCPGEHRWEKAKY